ncbi:hypothetical protein AURDEDRAFT_163321 [Auricularia subglabra TFB-10046 SS5]|nr:hypothetical protein AURDEDRAFT_163321 [Auricularia subglabra TFB-10046 SS5]
MWSADLTRHLPNELISRTLDYLKLMELIPILAVCRRWRRVALAHSSYWRFIKLDSVSDGAIDFFLLRLSRSGRRPIILEVNMEGPSHRIGAEVLPVVALHLGHVEYLCLGVHEAQAAAFLDTISWPAPQLTGISASIRLSEEAAGCPALPGDLFMNDAPKLEYVGFRNLDIPPEPPAALALAHEVLFGYSYNEADFAFISSVFCAFPRMRRLALHCGSLVVPPEPFIDPEWTAELEHLDVMVHPCSRDDVLAQFPCHTLPLVHVSNPASFTITNLLDMLPGGPLHLTLATDDEYPDEVFHIGVTSPSTGRERKFRQATSTFKGVDQMPHDLLRRVDFSARILTLTISYGLWLPLVHLLLPFPQLTELTLTVEAPLDALTSRSAGGTVTCPRLRDLRIRSVCGVIFMRTTWLAKFVTSSLQDVVLPISTLRISDVILDGLPDALTPLFKEVVFASCG